MSTFSTGKSSSRSLSSRLCSHAHTGSRWPLLPEGEQPTDDTTLRHDQLRIRLAEIEATLAVVRAITDGRMAAETENACRLKASRTLDWAKWQGMAECRDGTPILMGHSFGGTAVVSRRRPRVRRGPIG